MKALFTATFRCCMPCSMGASLILPTGLTVLLSGLTFLFSGTALAASTGQHLAEVPVPLGTQLHSVGSDVIHNGQLLAMATYESSLSLEDTLEYYQQLWVAELDSSLPGLVENRAGEWLLLGRLEGDLQTVLQLRLAESHRSSGYLSVMQIDTAASYRQSAPPLPGLERLSTTHSQDANRASVLSVYSSQQSVESLARQLSAHWQGNGWTLVSSEAYLQNKVLLLNRDSAQLEVVISSESSEYTLIVMNEVDDHD